MFNSLAELENYYRGKEIAIEIKYCSLHPDREERRQKAIEMNELAAKKTKDYKEFIEQQKRFKEKASNRELLEKIFEKVVLGR